MSSSVRLIGGYEAQYRRMIRYLEQAKRAAGDRVVVEDAWITFFMHAWHLKDHVKNDASISPTIKDCVNKAVHKADALMICRDLANGLKHFVPKLRKMTGSAAIVAVAGASVTYHPIIRLNADREERAIDIGERIKQCWDTVLRSAGLSLP